MDSSASLEQAPISKEKESSTSVKNLLCVILDLNFDVWMEKTEEILNWKEQTASQSK